MSDAPVLDSTPAFQPEEISVGPAEAIQAPEGEAATPANGSGQAAEGAPPAAAETPIEPERLDLLMDVSLGLVVELGRAHLTVRQVLDMQKGSVVELDRNAGEAVDVLVNDRLMARGEVVVVDDRFGVRITEIISPNRKGGER